MNHAASDWLLYAAHRARFTAELIAAGAGRGGRLCVLGAGPCNDLDLAELSQVFSEIHLVDLDAKALASALTRQKPEVRARIVCHAPVDLSGLSLKRLRTWKRFAPTPDELKLAFESALVALLARLGGPFDVVASACVLTQMSFATRAALGADHAALEAVRISLMGHHLNTMVGLTVAGGTLLFASDLVSSSFYPLEQLQPEHDLRAVMSELVRAGASYFAANPALIGALLSQVGQPELREPWLWTGPRARTYLVYAFKLTR